MQRNPPSNLVMREEIAMKPSFTHSPLDVCLQTSFAHAQIQLALDEELAWAHGLSYQDLVLLTLIARAPMGRIAVAELARPLGLSMSGVLRLVLPLEKTGHVLRDPAPAPDGKRYVALRPAGKTQLRNATVTAEATCATLIATGWGQQMRVPMAIGATAAIQAQAQ